MRLTEKYRPRSWDDVVGQDKIVNALKKIAGRGWSLPHMLFIGPPGCGKTSAANVLGKVIDPNLPEHARRFSTAIRLTNDAVFDAALVDNPRLIEGWQASRYEMSDKDYYRRSRQWSDEMTPHKVGQEIRAILV